MLTAIPRSKIAGAVLAFLITLPTCAAAQAQNAPAQAQNGAATTAPRTPITPAPQRRRAAENNLPAANSAAVDAGHQIFSQNCAFCHGANAKGGETGPDLLRSVLVLDDDGGNKIGPVVHNGRPGKGMPKFDLTDEQIANISAWLHDRIKATSERDTYQILNIVVGDPKQGAAYFNAHCTSCHSVTGDLAHIGSKYDAVGVQQHIVQPREERGWWMPRTGPETAPISVAVTLSSGETYSGKLEHVDDFTVALTTSAGEYRSFTRNGDTPKVEIHDPMKPHTEMLSKYTDADIHNLTAYLITLK
ncbi:MAG: c-type cytochrome [Acidobacteriaceae bacterium]|nr:c-type cytochrome [Acidobacteriaceae bacterium]